MGRNKVAYLQFGYGKMFNLSVAPGSSAKLQEGLRGLPRSCSTPRRLVYPQIGGFEARHVLRRNRKGLVQVLQGALPEVRSNVQRGESGRETCLGFRRPNERNRFCLQC